ncbi:domain of TilS substrate, partial [Snodgrassella alvi SCGC AB-598-J21]
WIDKYDVSGQWHWYGLLPVSSQKLVTARYLQWNRHPFDLAETDAAWRVRQADNEDTIVLRGGRKKVRKLLQERKIPPFMRAVWPVLCDSDNQCIAVINVAISIDRGITDGWMPIMEDLPLRL